MSQAPRTKKRASAMKSCSASLCHSQNQFKRMEKVKQRVILRALLAFSMALKIREVIDYKQPFSDNNFGYYIMHHSGDSAYCVISQNLRKLPTSRITPLKCPHALGFKLAFPLKCQIQTNLLPRNKRRS